MMKLDRLAIRTVLPHAQLVGLVVSMAACGPSVYTREPNAGLTATTTATGGGAAAVPGIGGAFQLQGDASGESGGAPAVAPIASGGGQGGTAISSAAEISGTGGASAASATGGASRPGTGGASGGEDAGVSQGAHDAALGSGGGSGGGQDAGTSMAGSGGAAAGGRGGAVPSATGGTAAGGSGPTGGGGPDVAAYSFELSVSDWQISSESGTATLSRATSRPFAGAASLEGAIVSKGAGLVQMFVQSPAVAPGSRVTFHFFVPTGAAIDWAEAFIQEGGLSTPAFAWTYAYLKAPELIFGAWNTVTVTLANGATAPITMGVQFHVAARWTGSVFVDSIGW